MSIYIRRLPYIPSSAFEGCSSRIELVDDFVVFGRDGIEDDYVGDIWSEASQARSVPLYVRSHYIA